MRNDPFYNLATDAFALSLQSHGEGYDAELMVRLFFNFFAACNRASITMELLQQAAAIYDRYVPHTNEPHPDLETMQKNAASCVQEVFHLMKTYQDTHLDAIVS